MSFEVQEPIQNTPFEKPQRYWFIQEGETPQLREGRRPAVIFPPRDQKEPWQTDERLLRPSKEYPSGYELVLVNRVREQLEKWREQLLLLKFHQLQAGGRGRPPHMPRPYVPLTN